MEIIGPDVLLSQSHGETQWLVEGLFKHGALGFVGASPKCGKSFLTLHIAQCVATGTPVLGRFAVPVPAKVLMIQEEDSAALVSSRYKLLEKGHNIPTPVEGYLSFAIHTGFRVDVTGAVEHLVKAVTKVGAALLVVDVLNKVHALSDNSQQHATRIMNVFEAARRRTGVAIILVHHFSKQSPNRRGNQRLRGSSVFAGWSENSLFLTREENTVSVEVENKFAQTEDFKYHIVGTPDSVRLEFGSAKFVLPPMQEQIQMSRKERNELLRRWRESNASKKK